MLTNKTTKNKTAKLAAVAVAVFGFASAYASGGGGKYLSANNDVANQASLQRGARNFVNYCMGCHSAEYVRYNRVGTDLGLSDQQVIDNLMFTGVRPSDTMQIAMRSDDAARWFGTKPPDLSLIARNKGVDYLFTFLKSFYVDPSRPTGMNNTVLPGAAMPHVLAELQGLQTAVYEGHADAEGNMQKQFKGFEQLTKGSMTAAEYDGFVRDTVNFLEYIAEPVQMKRRNLGIGVIFFLLVFFGFAYALKKEYWKDVK
jgi:ubiquinol-cytochrome c reductase cytochrome c1 subunit